MLVESFQGCSPGGAMLVLRVSPTHWATPVAFSDPWGQGSVFMASSEGAEWQAVTSGSSLVSLKEEDEAPGWVTTMGPVWGVRANQARITGRHRQLIHRGAGAPSQPTEPLHSRDGATCFWMDTLLSPWQNTTVSRDNPAIPSSPSSFPGEWKGWGIFVPWWSLALVSLQLQQPRAALWQLQNQLGWVKAQPGQKPLWNHWKPLVSGFRNTFWPTGCHQERGLTLTCWSLLSSL